MRHSAVWTIEVWTGPTLSVPKQFGTNWLVNLKAYWNEAGGTRQSLVNLKADREPAALALAKLAQPAYWNERSPWSRLQSSELHNVHSADIQISEYKRQFSSDVER